MKRFNRVAKYGAVAAVLASGSANAALSTEAQAAVTAVTTAAADWIGAGWSIAIAVVVGLTGIKLFKKVLSRAS